VNDCPVKIRPLGGWKCCKHIWTRKVRIFNLVKIRPLGGWKCFYYLNFFS